MSMDAIRAELGPLKFSIKPTHQERTPLTTNWMGEMERAAMSQHGFMVRHLQTGVLGLATTVPMTVDAFVDIFTSIGKIFEGVGKAFSGQTRKFEDCMSESLAHAWLAVKYVAMAPVTGALSAFVPEHVIEWNRDLGLAPPPKPLDVLSQVGQTLGLVAKG